MKKKLLLLSLVPLLLTSCGGENPTEPAGPGGTTTDKSVVKYTVTFVNTDMPSVQIEEGKTLAKPSDPEKANYLFVGWFMDAAFTTEVQFPLTITKDTSIYANFYSYQNAFEKARDNTIGEKVPGYEYDYTLQVTANYSNIAFNGNTTGNAKYVAETNDVSFYDEHVNSGSLFYDGTKYQMKKGNELHEISLDEDGHVNSYEIKQVGADYKYDSSSFAKAVFEYDGKKLKEIKPTQTANEYLLKTGFNFSAGVALVGKYVNHPLIEKKLGELPETSVNTGMYVTFTGDKLNSYRYEMHIDVQGLQFHLVYSLGFKNIGVAPTIHTKDLANVAITESEINSVKGEIDTYMNAYKALERSSYDFKLKTGVDFSMTNEINATIDGFTRRKLTGGTVYYLNDYEIDTDHKNADLYKDAGLKDCHGGRAKLTTGEVHDLKNKAIGSGYNDVKTVTHDPIDDYYLLDFLPVLGKINFIQKIADSKSGTTTYSIGTNNTGVANILTTLNTALRLNALGECSKDVKAYGAFDSSSVQVRDFSYNIIVTNGALSKVELDLEGMMKTSFPGSKDFTAVSDAQFKLDFDLTITNDGANFEPAATVDKIRK